MKKRILLVVLVLVGSFGSGLALSEYRQRAAIVIHYTMWEYNDDGTTYEWSKSVRVCNRRGQWTETQIFRDGNLRTASGKVTPRNLSFASFPGAPTAEILGRTVAVVFDRTSEMWFDPSTQQILKDIRYTDETRQTVESVMEAVEIKD